MKKIPVTVEDTHAQGFIIIPPEKLGKYESKKAKQYWSGDGGVKKYYTKVQSWAPLLNNAVKKLKPRSILEFGCNAGRNLACIQKEMPKVKCTGIDINKTMLKKGRKKYKLDLRIGDETYLSKFKTSSFDLIFTVSVLDHIPNIQYVCEELIRCAKRHLFCIEISLPIEGKLIKYFDHREGEIMSTIDATYSWHIEKYMKAQKVEKNYYKECSII